MFRRTDRVPRTVSEARATAGGCTAPDDGAVPGQSSECSEGEKPKSAVGAEMGPPGSEGRKPSRGYPNPEGGPKAGVEPRRTSGSSEPVSAEGQQSP